MKNILSLTFIFLAFFALQANAKMAVQAESIIPRDKVITISELQRLKSSNLTDYAKREELQLYIVLSTVKLRRLKDIEIDYPLKEYYVQQLEQNIQRMQESLEDPDRLKIDEAIFSLEVINGIFLSISYFFTLL